MADVRLTADAARSLEKLKEPIHARILALLERLEKWPEVSGIKWLKGNLAGKCRLRTGDYRVVFSVNENKVLVEAIDNRKDVYG